MSKIQLRKKLEVILSQCLSSDDNKISDLDHISTWTFVENNRGNKGELHLYGLTRYGYSNRAVYRRLKPMTVNQFSELISIKNEYNELCSSGDLFTEEETHTSEISCPSCGESGLECYCGDDDD